MANEREKINFWLDRETTKKIEELIRNKHYHNITHFFVKASAQLLKKEKQLGRVS